MFKLYFNKLNTCIILVASIYIQMYEIINMFAVNALKVYLLNTNYP